jgi:diaminopimelate decarboxylase
MEEVPVRKSLPFPIDVWREIAKEYGTPVYVYDEAGIRANARRLLDAFSWAPSYRNFFAVKACPTPAILRIVASEGMGFDCSSRGELVMIQEAELSDHGLFFSSNNTPDEDYAFAHELGATINLDKHTYADQVRRVFKSSGWKPPAAMAIRYNPGSRVGAGSTIMGEPEKAKFGARREHVIAAVKELREWGVPSVGLHTMVVSNERNVRQFATTALALRDLALEIAELTGRAIDFINVGGGLGVTYNPADPPVDVEGMGTAIAEVLRDLGVKVVSEHGRYVTGPHGYLLTEITRGKQEVYETFLQVDTSINNIARLATVKAAYHQLDVLGKENDERQRMNVTGSMCANTDIMFKAFSESPRIPDCLLPKTAAPKDLLVIHDAGAHCRANAHNYNFKLRCGEVLVREDGTHAMIRRHETMDDVLATVKDYLKAED